MIKWSDVVKIVVRFDFVSIKLFWISRCYKLLCITSRKLVYISYQCFNTFWFLTHWNWCCFKRTFFDLSDLWSPNGVSKGFSGFWNRYVLSQTLRVISATYDRKSMLETKYIAYHSLNLALFVFSSSYVLMGITVIWVHYVDPVVTYFDKNVDRLLFCPWACFLIIVLDFVLGIVFGKTWNFFIEKEI